MGTPRSVFKGACVVSWSWCLSPASSIVIDCDVRRGHRARGHYQAQNCKRERGVVKHMAYPTRYPLEPGVQISILVSPIHAGDRLSIEYPNGKRGSAKVLHCGENALDIIVGKARWRLAPLAPEEVPEAPIRFAQKPVPIWVIQPK